MPIPERLIHKLKMGRCILFLGSGASISSGGPSGKALSEYLRDEIGLNPDEYDDDLAIYTEILYKGKKATRKQIETVIKKRLEALTPSKGFKALTCVSWKAIYTTNYDMVLENAYRDQSFFNLVTINTHNQCDTMVSYEIPYYKIHGSISEVYDPSKPLIVSFSDIKENKKQKKELMNRLMNDLVDTILFVGYSFQDGVITDLLDELTSSPYWGNVGDKYAVVPKTNPKDLVRFSAFGVTPIENTFDAFFSEVEKNVLSDYQTKLAAFQKGLKIEMGDKIREFDPQVKLLLDTFFDYYEKKDAGYPFDAQYFYRGGKPTWGGIVQNSDVPRTTLLNDLRNNKISSASLNDVVDLLTSLHYDLEPRFTRCLLSGPAAVGKTTYIYRLAFELMNKGVLTLIYNSLGEIRQGLLSEIYKCNDQKPYVLIVDSAASNSMQINKIYSEIIEKALPITVILSTRMNEWNIYVDGPIKKRLNQFDITLQLEDRLEAYQSERLVEKLVSFNVVQCTAERSKADLIQIFKDTNHLMVSLISVVSNTSFDKAISSEYDLLSLVGKTSYGLISLVGRFGLPFKWELLQRTLNRLCGIDWSEFVEKIVRSEGKDVIREEGTSPTFYYTCRHSFIAEKVVLMHYKGIKKDEVLAYKTIIESVNSGTAEEMFLGRMLLILIRSQYEKGYSKYEIISLLDSAISNFSDPSFSLHLKGQFLLDQGEPEKALDCFNKNIGDIGRNTMYSLHSAGMAHFAIAKNEPKGSGRRQIEILEARNILWAGLNDYPDNSFFQKSLLQVLKVKGEDGTLSEEDSRMADRAITLSRNSPDLDADDLDEHEHLFWEIHNYL